MAPCGHALADGGEARGKHRDERVGGVAVFVGGGAALGLAGAAALAGGEARAHGRTDAEGGVEVDEVEADVGREEGAGVEGVGEEDEAHGGGSRSPMMARASSASGGGASCGSPGSQGQ